MVEEKDVMVVITAEEESKVSRENWLGWGRVMLMLEGGKGIGVRVVKEDVVEDAEDEGLLKK